MKMQKTRDVKTPQRGTNGSAGYDFFIPNDYHSFTLGMGESALIPSGIKCQIPKNHALLAVSKSGVATKKHLAIGACLVDEDYTGEIHLHVYNWSKEPTTIEPGEKLVQFILTPVVYEDIEVVEDIAFETTERGSGGFGSTGNGVAQQPTLPSDELPMIKRKPGVVASLVRKDHTKESIKTGWYTRHYFRNVDNPSIEYILDVASSTKACFKKIEIGDTFMGLHTFMHTNGKHYINGKTDAEYIGKIGTIRNQLIKPKKKAVDMFATFSKPMLMDKEGLIGYNSHLTAEDVKGK
jgi:dUTP pyrophosphatase